MKTTPFDESMDATTKRLTEAALSGAIVTCFATDLHRVLAALTAATAQLEEARGSGVGLIAAERQRQLSLGWSSDHDDEHQFAALAKHAAELAVNGTDAIVVDAAEDCDRWGLVAKHKGDRIKQLVIAGALIAAEIDRLNRKALAAMQK